MSKTKVEVWFLLVLFICGSFLFLYLNSLPTPDTNLQLAGGVGNNYKMTVDLKDCEEKSTQTKLYLAERLTELTDLRQKVDNMESSSTREGSTQNAHLLALEDEVKRLKKLSKNDNNNVLSQITLDHSVLRRTLEVSNYLPTFDNETIGSNPSYNVTTDIKCWAPNCEPDVLNNRAAYAECQLTLATTWNAIGVKNMERFVATGRRYPQLTVEHARYLALALDAFSNATVIDPTCARVFVNLAIVLMQYDKSSEALDSMRKALELDKSATNWVILGFAQDFANDRAAAVKSWDNALLLDPFIGERKYFGVMVVMDTQPHRHEQNPIIRENSRTQELPMARDVLTFIEFSPKSVSNHATLPPGTQEFFVKNQFIILKDVVPPFILHSVAHCFQTLRENGLLHLGDHQSKRYSAYNSRAGRSLQYQLIDLMRRVILHNVQPTYSFFGGYIGGATLPPHSDKPQCEFTVSLTLQQFPEDATPWAVSLGKRPNFDRNDAFRGDPHEDLPPEDEIVDAYLYPGDCLLFMGRHLTHFRRTTLPADNGLDQIFFHHVQDSFAGIYDI